MLFRCGLELRPQGMRGFSGDFPLAGHLGVRAFLAFEKNSFVPSPSLSSGDGLFTVRLAGFSFASFWRNGLS